MSARLASEASDEASAEEAEAGEGDDGAKAAAPPRAAVAEAARVQQLLQLDHSLGFGRAAARGARPRRRRARRRRKRGGTRSPCYASAALRRAAVRGGVRARGRAAASSRTRASPPTARAPPSSSRASTNLLGATPTPTRSRRRRRRAAWRTRCTTSSLTARRCGCYPRRCSAIFTSFYCAATPPRPGSCRPCTSCSTACAARSSR